MCSPDDIPGLTPPSPTEPIEPRTIGLESDLRGGPEAPTTSPPLEKSGVP
jgi:hypothetical protein